jgi:hypothetical protein
VITCSWRKPKCGMANGYPWLKQHCPRIAERTARSYMRLAGNWAQLNLKSATVADLTINEALALLAAPDEPDEPITGDLLPVDGPAPGAKKRCNRFHFNPAGL